MPIDIAQSIKSTIEVRKRSAPMRPQASFKTEVREMLSALVAKACEA